MKAIIFDLDNTLIEWQDEYLYALRNVLKEMGYKYDEDMVKKINYYIDNHEKYYDKLTKENFLEFINKNCNINLPIEFINKLIIAQKDLAEEDNDLIETLEYLSKKYDLYVITNWFTETQKGRLEKIGALKYFKKVIGADINYYKPNKKVFDVILKDYNVLDCIHVGDSFENDVKLPLSLGMRAIWKTNKKDKNYETIKNLVELKDIL